MRFKTRDGLTTMESLVNNSAAAADVIELTFVYEDGDVYGGITYVTLKHLGWIGANDKTQVLYFRNPNTGKLDAITAAEIRNNTVKDGNCLVVTRTDKHNESDNYKIAIRFFRTTNIMA